MHYEIEYIIILYFISVNTPHLTHIWNIDISQEVLYTVLFHIIFFLTGLMILIKKTSLQPCKNLNAHFANSTILSGMTWCPTLVTATWHSPYILPLYICHHYSEKWTLDEERRGKGWQIDSSHCRSFLTNSLRSAVSNLMSWSASVANAWADQRGKKSYPWVWWKIIGFLSLCVFHWDGRSSQYTLSSN